MRSCNESEGRGVRLKWLEVPVNSLEHHKRVSAMTRFAVAIVVGCVASWGAIAAEPLQKKEWTVGETKREALVHAPAKAEKEPSPLVFVFHGHGGTMKNASTKMAIHEHWPEAICVYPQGLPTPGKLTDPEGKKAGWQHGPGEQDDRDLKFFDNMLKSLRADYKVDDKRVFVTGHSNGGRFTQLLWAERGEVFAAVAPSGTTASNLTKSLKPKPCLHIAGEKDELVKFEWQKATMDAIKKLNGCEAEGKPWQKDGLLYESKTGTPLVTWVYPGGHAFPAEAPKVIATFFKEHAKK
jgi:polyhydroxybutyrate depolymerase